MLVWHLNSPSFPRRLLRSLAVTGMLLIAPVHASSLTPAVYNSLEQAQNLLADQKHQEALQILQRVLQRSRSGSLDQAMTWQLIGHTQADTGNETEAITAYENALKQDSLPPALQRAVIGNLAQLHIRQQQYERGLQLLEDWLATQEANADTRAATSPELYMLAAHAAAQLTRYPVALQHAQTAFSRHNSAPESWYQMLIGLHVQLSQHEQARQRLYQVIARFAPRKQYWRQLMALYLADQNIGKALQSWQMAQQDKLFDEAQDWMQLANLYANHQQPFQAAQALQEGLDSGQLTADINYWRRLAGFWQAARERPRAIAALQQLASISQDSRDHLRLAQLLISEERWQEARTYLQSARQHASETELNEVHYWLGVVAYELDDLDTAQNNFRHIGSTGKYARQAQQWLAYLRQSDNND